MYGSGSSGYRTVQLRAGRPAYPAKNDLMFSDTIYYYPVQESNEVFQVPVSATEKADYDRTFGVEIIDKESNAIEGKHYSLLSRL